MKITLSNYRPFAFTRGAIDVTKKFGQASHRNCSELALKVAFVAGAILACLVTVIMDLIVWPISALYRCCHKEPILLSQPDRQFISQAILENPYSGMNTPYSAVQFFQDALQKGLVYNHSLTPVIKEMIRNHGEPDEGEAPFNIWLWSASCLLAHYLVAESFNTLSHYFPASYSEGRSLPPYQTRSPSALAHEKGVAALRTEFLKLSRDDRSSALIHLTVPALAKSDLTAPAKQFVNLMGDKAHGMIRDTLFLKLYKSTTANMNLSQKPPQK